MLTEHEIARTWRALFHEGGVGEDALARAEALLEELRPESPLRHRLAGELVELRKIHAPPPRKRATRGKG
ncbi:MAG: hypothetical protein ABSG86_18800 [Thermoguttaceae bacterium]